MADPKLPTCENVYFILTAAPLGKSKTDVFSAVIINDVIKGVPVKVTVLLGPSNAYAVPETKAWLCFTEPYIMPFPRRVLVTVNTFIPVFTVPFAMFTVAAVMLLLSTTKTPVAVFIVKLLNVVSPDMVTLVVGVKRTVPVDDTNVPWFTNAPLNVCVKAPALKVVAAVLVKLLLTVILFSAVLVEPPSNTKLS